VPPSVQSDLKVATKYVYEYMTFHVLKVKATKIMDVSEVASYKIQ